MPDVNEVRFRRKKVQRTSDRRFFSKNADKTRKENFKARPMRGGIRL